jgi:hypothetical protein
VAAARPTGRATRTLSPHFASYDIVVGVGDITGDGRADLVCRYTSGTVWRNDGNVKGSFSGRTRIATGRQGYQGLS